jgi:hypothetical protein
MKEDKYRLHLIGDLAYFQNERYFMNLIIILWFYSLYVHNYLNKGLNSNNFFSFHNNYIPINFFI